MARESKEIYHVMGCQNLNDLAMQLNFILPRIAERLDIIEGLNPDLSAGLYKLSGTKSISTLSDTIGEQDPSSVSITGGVIKITDVNGTVIHQLSEDA